MKRIVLASTSPRREALLKQIGLKFTVDARVLEDIEPVSQEPHQLVIETAMRKAKSVANEHPDAIIIAADTFGVIDSRTFGKQHNEMEARALLAGLSGKAHTVITGFTVLDTLTGKTISRSVETTVYMKQLTKLEIEAYVRTGEPLDKAGAYAIQGLGAVLVEKIEGDYFNVVGLPLHALSEVLKEFGINVLE
jgi:septum formation protein